MLYTRYELLSVQLYFMMNVSEQIQHQNGFTQNLSVFVLRFWAKGGQISEELMLFMLFYPQLPSQYPSAPAPKPSAPPPTAPKPALSFLPPPEMGDRPPPAPWAEELKARTNRQANHNSAPNSAAQSFSKAPAVAPKSGFGGRPTNSSVSLAQKLNQNLNQNQNPPIVSVSPKPSPPYATSSFPPPPAAPPAPFTPPKSMVAAPTSNHTKSSPFASQINVNQNPPAAVPPPPQPKMMTSPPASFNQPMKSPPASTVCPNFILAMKRLGLHSTNSRKNRKYK